MEGDNTCWASTPGTDDKYMQNCSLTTYWDTTCTRSSRCLKKALKWILHELRGGFGLNHVRMGASGEIL
jgi:hypothetical protein